MKSIRILLVSTCLIVAGCDEEPERWPMTRFDQAQWARTSDQQRFVFVRDLIRTKTLLGLRRQQVQHVLGPPSFEDADGEYLTYVVKADNGTVYLLDLHFAGAGADKVVARVLVRPD